MAKEFIFSGSEQNPDLTDKEIKKLIGKVTSGVAAPIQAFMDNGEDWVVADNLPTLVEGMNEIVEASSGGESGAAAPKIDLEKLEEQISQRDMQTGNPFSKDYQVNYVNVARNFLAGQDYPRRAAITDFGSEKRPADCYSYAYADSQDARRHRDDSRRPVPASGRNSL